MMLPVANVAQMSWRPEPGKLANSENRRALISSSCHGPRGGAEAGVINAPHYSVENLRMCIQDGSRATRTLSDYGRVADFLAKNQLLRGATLFIYNSSGRSSYAPCICREVCPLWRCFRGSSLRRTSRRAIAASFRPSNRDQRVCDMRRRCRGFNARESN